MARHVLAMTHILFWAESATSPLPSLARSVLAPLAAPVVPYVLTRRRLVAAGIRFLSQLRTHYRHSRLSEEGTPRGCHGARPGERLPDGLVQVDGRRRRLHELLAHPGVHVLLERDAAALGDVDFGPLVRFHRILDWPGAGAVAVRPDGYVGLRTGRASCPDLAGWLARVAALRSPSQARA